MEREHFHLTTSQQNIWNLQKYYGDTAIANLCGAMLFQERKDLAILQEAVRQFIRSQSGIRLCFCEEKEPVQYVSEEIEETVSVLNFGTGEELDCYAEDIARKPIGLADQPMYRFAVFHLKDGDRSGILVTLSHLISDAWTFGLMAGQIDVAYRNLAGETDIAPVEGDYVDFIKAEEQYFASERYRKDKSFWEEKYTARPEATPIKLCQMQVNAVEARRVTRTLPVELEQNIATYCKNRPVTQAVLFETALILYLSRINPENQTVTVGVPVLNRSGAKEKAVAGMFVSTMPLTLSVWPDMEIMDLAGQITREHMNLFRHQKYPYGDILRSLREKQDFSGNLYDVMISYQNARTKTGADTKWYSNGYSEVPLVIHIDNRDGKDSHTINVDYQTAVFRDEEEIGFLIERLEYILGQIVEEKGKTIGDIGIVPPREYEKVIHEFNDTYVEYPREKCVHELFMEQVAKTPERIALVFEDQKFTYRQLDEMSNSLAHFLREKGVGRGDIVPIIARRSWHVIVAMLGILKAGGAYMPVDPEYPEDRISYMLKTAGSRLALVYGHKGIPEIETISLDMIDFGENIGEIRNVSTPEDSAYIIFTSGSTGKPKGVQICHRNVCNYVNNNTSNSVCHKLINNQCRSIVSVTNFIFDIFVTESLLPLTNGLSVYLANDGEAVSQEKLSCLLTKGGVDVLQTTPTKMRSFLMDRSNTGYLKRLKAIILGGEAFPEELYHTLWSLMDAHIYNIYGPAETTVWSTNAEVAGADITIGTPIANTQIYILDGAQRPVPIGVPGELCIAGEGVGLGYLNRPRLTSERFIPNPFATGENHHGKTMYRTGDLARFRSDGEIEYLGRMDTQVKIRGLRIELGEIESVMGSFLGISLCAVADKKDGAGRQYLVGYYTSGESVDEKALRSHLSAKLPKYMVPNYFMRLDAMPMTASGKTDRKNLPVPDFNLHEEEYIPPATATEERLALIWRRLLSVERVGRTENFFELGGDSLLAISTLNEIEREFHAEVSIRDIMEQSSLERMALCIDHAKGRDGSLTAYYEDRYVLLPQQKAIYAACRKEPDTLLYNMPAKIAIPPEVDRGRLAQSIRQVLEHHKILKSCVREAEDEIYGVYDKSAQVRFEEYRDGGEEKFVRVFDLGKAPLVHIGFTETALLFDMHHIIADGGSLQAILGDIAAFYGGKELQKSELWFGDYARYFQGSDFGGHRAYFKEMLKCEFEPVILPGTRKPGKGGVSRVYFLPEDVFGRARRFARENGLTGTMVFLGAYGILLSKYAGKKDILSSVILQNRTHADTRGMAGMFVNTLPIYLAVNGKLMDYMGRVREAVLNLMQYQELPFLEIAEAVGMADKSVVNTSFVYQGDGEKKLVLDGQDMLPQFVDTHTSKFDLSLELTPLDTGCRMRLEYDLAKYDGELADRLAESYIRILGQLDREEVADISVLSEEEYHRIVEEFNDTYVEYPREKCVHELFTEQAARTPERVALVFEDQKFSYRQLDEMSNSLAHFLREKGVGRGDIVPIIARRSWHVVVAMLGVLKAGGAYMPVAPEYPEDRVSYMLETAKSRLALVYGHQGISGIEIISLDTVDFSGDIGEIRNANTLEDPAYIIFTSGSTGKPKGVTLCHRNVCNYVDDNVYNSVCHKLIDNQCQGIVSVTNIIFDIFVTESLLPLTNGLCVYLANDKEAVSQEKLSRLLTRSRADVLQTTPTKMRSFLMDRSNTGYLKGLKAIILGGEAFPEELYHTLRSLTDAHIYNIYGPAETTVWSTNAEVAGADITIGTPIANTQIYILDGGQRPVPIGVPGELCIAGEGVGLGYLNRPQLTAERFIPNPFVTEENHHRKTMYRTGDLARFRSDGEIEYLGRMDTQVKVRGLRIELGEIEGVMGSFPGIGLCAVADKKDGTGRQYLVGYYTVMEEICGRAEETMAAQQLIASVDEKALRSHLSAKLPKYMVPNYFMRLDTMPMTASGKTDRKNLPVPDFNLHEEKYIPPATATEERLALIWRGLLSVERVGRTDDFFELGGDSLLAISALNEIESEFHAEVSIRDIMEQSSLERMAQCIDHAKGRGGSLTACHEERYVLLPQQKAIYAACRKEPGTLLYNMPARITLPPEVDRERLVWSIRQVLERHKILKSCIREEGNEIYGVYDENAQVQFEEYQDGGEENFIRAFDLGRAPLVHIGFTETALLFDMHHIIADGGSLQAILRDIAASYGGKELCNTGLWFGDYTRYFHRLDFSEHKTYFKDILKCDFEPVILPETRKPGQGGVSGIYFLPEDIFGRVRRFARENGLTGTMVFLGAYGILLSKYAGKKDVLSSIILQNRTHADTRGMAGMFVNTLPVYLAVDGKLTDYMGRVRETVLNLMQYQELPFQEIAEAVGMADKSVVNTSFVYQGDGEKKLVLDGQDMSPQFMDTHTSKFDLSMELTPLDTGCRMRLEYNLAKYDGELADRLAEAYIRILGQLDREEVADISVLSEEEYHRIVEEFNDTYVEYPREKCVHELFTEQAARTPERVALVFEDQKFSYRQLDEMSNSLAHFLREKGVGRGDIVPIIARRSWHVVVAILGVLKAGGAYMPVDPEYPEDRINYMLSETKTKFILIYEYKNTGTYETIDLAEVDYDRNRNQVENCNSGNDKCYVLYTSGSAGRPKAVCISHVNMANFNSNNNNNHYQHAMLEACGTVLADTEFIFDISVFEIFLSLLNGLCLVLAKDVMDALHLAGLIEEYHVDALHITPTKLLTLLRDQTFQKAIAQVKVLMVGAEVFTESLYQTVSKYTDATIYNGYGPTETTIGCSFKKVDRQQCKCVHELYGAIRKYSSDGGIHNIYDPAETTVCAVVNEPGNGADITIGTPIANTQIYILDGGQRPVPNGVPGELCIAGEGVGLGYLNRPQLTAERFIPNPFATEENRHGKTMYRTGDLARFRSDGEIEYLGRMDTQVKVRGLRIELGEIESVMGSFPGIGLCAVADKKDRTGRQYLVGYYTVMEELCGRAEETMDAQQLIASVDEKALRSHLSAKLPKYMVPNYFMRLDAMPMTASGKTDRKNLPVPDFTQQAGEYVPPVTEREKVLCCLMEELLHVERAGVTDDFFELGGDSLIAIEFLAKSHDRGIDFALQNIFDYPTVRQLCGHLEAGEEGRIQYKPADFDRYRGLLAENVIDEAFVPERKYLGNVLLTGATGFLGAHVLDVLLREETGKVYCLVRDGKDAGNGERSGCGERLRDTLRYYFGDRYEGEFTERPIVELSAEKGICAEAMMAGKELCRESCAESDSGREWVRRIIPIAGNIESDSLAEDMPEDVQTVIHTAASVKHYGSYDYFHRVNVEGTKHVADYAKSVGARLIHISTLSVSGNSLADAFDVYRSEEEKHFGETSFYIGQPLDNVYVHSKFEAERAVLDAMLTGLDAKIIRVGNLTSRASDYKFQPNYRENAFLTRCKAILEFGLFPEYLMPLYCEFSPIDLTAEGVVRIARYADRQTVFHLNSNRPIYFDRFLEAVQKLGIPMKVVTGGSFNRALRDTIHDRVTEYIFEAFQNDMDEQGRLVYDSNIRIDNDFTVWFLGKTGFEWNEIGLEYIRGYVEYFRGIGYLTV